MKSLLTFILAAFGTYIALLLYGYQPHRPGNLHPGEHLLHKWINGYK